ncbi:Gpi16 subunit, GPI transamidase component [Sistotremastrum niveocremeum HHB9708]|uniref:Gpi16 subunit, GPI transamidase component n=2 Tax=Sistotremastraceae TaxID=3402574 RepID=A0A164V6L0_9AGAM|nr:Gpi16 subunit, GPI transamidase component [Sistotremastrum niveocremeum HHB9708]KZT36430.1 Gpi16 subunit, GPI transamidase component [Sistotremastrum suecicum HHB10207 ss-3]
MILSCDFLAAQAYSDRFTESLVIRPLEDGKVASLFTFTTLMAHASGRDPINDSEDKPQHYTIFPLSLGQILREYAITELHLTLNAGKWDYLHWGTPEDADVGSGAEMWAWMADGGADSIDSRWVGVRNAVSGLLCASLSSLSIQRTTSPLLAFPPLGDLPVIRPTNQTDASKQYHLRHASLPSEHVCTENLTPFLKLLPCKSSSGLASLLNPHKLFDADWHGMGVHVRWLERKGVEVKLTFQAVVDPVRYSPTHSRDASLGSMFDRAIEKPCPVAAESMIQVKSPTDAVFHLSPDAHMENGIAVYDLAEAEYPLDISLRWPAELSFNYLFSSVHTSAPIRVTRVLRDASQTHGRLTVSIINESNHTQYVAYLETVPWFIQFYLHTLRITVDGEPRPDLLHRLSYTPAIPHADPTVFEPIFTLPPLKALRFTMEVEKAFLRYTEHPPDAQRGWDLPPAVVLPIQNPDLPFPISPYKSQRIYTSTLLVDLPTPDFSMPYNVILMTSTLVALFFANIFNTLTRRFVWIQTAVA